MGYFSAIFTVIRPRIRASIRVLRLAVTYRIAMSLKKPMILKATDGQELGYLDIAELRECAFRVSGWTKADSIRISTEAQTVDIPADIVRTDLSGKGGAKGFECVIAGSDYLQVMIGDQFPFRDVLRRTDRHTFAAWVRTLILLGTLPVRHGSDIVGWFLRGDSEAGTRLERTLLPLRTAHAHPIARSGVFTNGLWHPSASPDPVDILIPVHNAHDDLTDCLARVERFTSPAHRVIVIDDASTDLRVGTLLSDYAKKRGNVVHLTNTRNLGFVASVNLGLSHCRGDVVLLNSDAMVSSGWLDRLMAPILADPAIASVTPMTNNGEIASVPVICKAGDLNKGDADRINAAACRLDPVTAVVGAPTGVGFCMALSRHWLQRIPRLDAVFGRGYGEEVDWCRKVAAQGGRHVLTGALFVEHRGGKSFGPEKARQIAENNRIISHRYPDYDAAVARFIDQDPGIGVRLALGLVAAERPGMAVPIYLAHRLGGGAENWLLEDVSRHLGAGQSVAILRDGDIVDSVLIELHTPDGTTKGQVPLHDLPQYLAGPKRRRMVYSNLVAAREPIALLSHAVSALHPADDFCVAFHDFFPLCPSYNLIGSNGQYCGIPNGQACQRCYASLAQTSGQRPATIAEWRHSWRQLMDRATEIVVFSNDSRDHVTRVWPDLAEKILVRPHSPPQLPAQVTASGNDRLIIGVLGAIGYNKGAKILQDLASCMDANTDIIVIGKLDPTYAHPRVAVHGPYDRDEISVLAARYRVGVWLIPSIWPETFCYAVHEALSTGLPVMVFDLGAQAEAASAAQNGHLLPYGCAGVELERHLRDKAAGAVPVPDNVSAGMRAERI